MNKIARQEKKQIFIHALAEYIAGDSMMKSIRLEMGKPDAEEWAKVRNATPVFGNVSVEEAEKVLAEFLS